MAEVLRLRAENEALRRQLGERDDYLYQIGKLSRAYENSIDIAPVETDEELAP